MVGYNAKLFRVGLIAAAAVAVAVRLTVFLRHYRGAPFGFNDAEYYSEQAVRLADGRWFTDPATGGPVAEHGPLTSLLLAPVSWMDSPQDWQRLGTLLVGVATVLVLGLVGRRIGGPVVGLAAAGLAAIYPNLWINDGLVMSESVAALAIALWLLAGLAWWDRRSPGRALLFGALAAAAALARSELVVLVGLTLLVVAWRPAGSPRLRSLGVVAAGVALVLGPWVGPNLVRFERPVLLTTNDGTTLRGANCDQTYAGRAVGSWSVFCLIEEPETVAMEPSLRSQRWRGDGLAYARDHAGRLPLVVSARVGRSLDLFGLDYQVDEDVRDGRPRWASWAAVGSFWALAPVAAVGLTRGRRLPRLLLAGPVVAVAASTVLFYGGHRIRAPIEPTIVLAAAVAAVELARRARRRLQPRRPEDVPAAGDPADGAAGGDGGDRGALAGTAAAMGP